MKAVFKPYTGVQPPVTEDILRRLVTEKCHNQQIDSIEPYGDFFGSKTWRIQSYSFAAGALQKPDGILLIRETLFWPLLPEHAPNAVVHIADYGDGLCFWLKPRATPDNEGAPDWHLLDHRKWPEFAALFDEQSENDFVPIKPMSCDEIISSLRKLGFQTFEDDMNDTN